MYETAFEHSTEIVMIKQRDRVCREGLFKTSSAKTKLIENESEAVNMYANGFYESKKKNSLEMGRENFLLPVLDGQAFLKQYFTDRQNSTEDKKSFEK